MNQKIIENTDSLEHSYVKYFEDEGFLISLLPNKVSSVTEYVSKADCIVLTGGDDYERPLEKSLIKEGLFKGIPILGICRGMHIINLYYGGKIKPVKNHTRESISDPVKVHEIMVVSDFLDIDSPSGLVNSFHNFGITSEEISDKLSFFALAEDGVIEGIFHKEEKIIGIQWHPERTPSSDWVSKRLTDFLKDKL